ncbi:ABC transporter ATP-binding protein [Furfurilactobacillus entadae]|uniref:ABC transporter ATP-binding protein n=1 Tax=Furfurilactobacillus entadae TaxID=2922307 RepID=UPI0035E4FA8E
MIIEAQHVAKRYGKTTAVNDVSLTVNEGELIGLVGENGAGKTTLINMVLGLQHPTTGTLTVFNQAPGSAEGRLRIGAMLQENVTMKNINVDEALQLVTSFYPNPVTVSELLTTTNLTEVAHHRMGALSGGQRRRLAFGMAIAGNPDVIFLDEPTVGMDVLARNAFWDQIKHLQQQGKTIFMTSHYLEEIEAVADRVIIMAHGAFIYDGTMIDLKTRYRGVEITFTTPLPLEKFTQSDLVTASQKAGTTVHLQVTNGDQWLIDHQELLTDMQHLTITPRALETIFKTIVEAGEPA